MRRADYQARSRKNRSKRNKRIRDTYNGLYPEVCLIHHRKYGFKKKGDMSLYLKRLQTNSDCKATGIYFDEECGLWHLM